MDIMKLLNKTIGLVFENESENEGTNWHRGMQTPPYKIIIYSRIFPGREKRKLFSHPSLMALNLKASECWGSKWRGDRCGFEKWKNLPLEDFLIFSLPYRSLVSYLLFLLEKKCKRKVFWHSTWFLTRVLAAVRQIR